MARQFIDEFISQKALDQFLELQKRLKDSQKEMANLINISKNYLDLMMEASNKKEFIDARKKEYESLINLNNVSEKNNEIKNKLINVTTKISNSIKNEISSSQQLDQVLSKISVTRHEMLNELVRTERLLNNNKNSQKELTKEYKNGEIGIEKYHERMVNLREQQGRLNISLSEYKIAIKTLDKENATTTGSMAKMSQELGRLRDIYRNLTEEELNDVSIGGVLKQRIVELDNYLKKLDSSIGNNQRSIGNYEIAGKTFNAQMRNVKEMLNEIGISIDQYDNKILEQTNLVNNLASTEGILSNSYIKEKQELDNLIKGRENASNSAKMMNEAAVQLQKQTSTTTSSLKSLSSETPNLDAVNQGFQTITSTYQVFQAAMVAAGIENQNLIEIFAKMQIIQQGVNSLTQISNNLSKRSILGIKLRSAAEKIYLAYKQAIVKEELKDTAATTASTTAKAAGTTVNTAFSLSLRGIGAAIKSIPGIGWAIAIAGALAGVIPLIKNIVVNTKELTKEQQIQNKLIKEQSNLSNEVALSTNENIVRLKAYVSELNNVNKGSEEWENIVKQISELTNTNYEYLINNENKINDITDAWIKQYTARAKMDAIIKTNSEREVKSIELINKLIGKDFGDAKVNWRGKLNDQAKELSKEIENIYNLTTEQSQDLFSNFYKSSKMGTSIEGFINELKKRVEELNKNLTDTIKWDEILSPGNDIINASKNINESISKDLENLYKIRIDSQLEHQRDRIDIEINYQKKLEELNKKGLGKNTIQYKYELSIIDQEHKKSVNNWINNEKLRSDALSNLNKSTLKSYNELLEEIIKTYDFIYNEKIVKLGRSLTDIEQSDLLIRQINSEISALDSLGNSVKDYVEKRTNLESQLTIELENNAKIRENILLKEKESREILQGAIIQSFDMIAQAATEGIKDEKQRMIAQKSIALSIVILEQSIAIAKAIGLAMESSNWYEAAAKMVIGIGSVTAQFMQLKNAINSSITSVPGYSKGIINHPGGGAVISEKDPELVDIKGFGKMLFEKPTYIKDLTKGSSVYPLNNLKKIENISKIDYNNFDNKGVSVISSKLDDVKNAVISKGNININVGKSVSLYMQKGKTRSKIINKKINI